MEEEESRLVIEEHSPSHSSSLAAEENTMDVPSLYSQKSVTNNGEGTQSTQDESASARSASVIFSWTEYLDETGAIAAPEDCFYQDPVPPRNNFVVGKKVEVPDLRGKEVRCLATIVAIHSLWIRVRLDGEDASNDQWFICDDECVKPIGQCEKNGLILQPPTGFKYDLTSFHKFIENQLKPTVDGSIPTATLESFAPISFSNHPGRNKFQVGMKCEAIDRRNFNGRPCPATVVDVKGDYLTISYDGWNEAYNIRERYDSRFIFPVGWAVKCGLEVQPPKRVKGKIMQSFVPETSNTFPKTFNAVAVRNSNLQKKKSVNRKTKQGRSRKQKHASASTPHRNFSVDTHSPHLLDIIDQIAKQSTVEAGPISSASSIRQMASSVEILCDSTVPRARKTMPSPFLPKKLSSKKSWKPGNSSNCSHIPDTTIDTILSTKDMQQKDKKMTVYLNRDCRCAPLLNTTLVRNLPEKFGPGCLHHILRETLQQVVNCAIDPSSVFEKIDAGTPRILSVTAEINGLTHVRAIPIVKTLASAWEYLRTFISKLNVCRNFLMEEPLTCPLCSCLSDYGVVSTTAGGSVLKCGGESDDSEDYEGREYSHLMEWSIERVGVEVENLFGAEIADKFIQNQIDGKALMLLTTELLIRHLEMPFGLALKVMSHIETLRNSVRFTATRAAK